MADYNPNPPLLQACCNEAIRRRILSHLSTSDQCHLRQISCAFSNMLTKSLFTKIRITFMPSSLSRQCRIEALGRIGHHIKHFTFSMHHSDATFLPPLLNPNSGQEINFLYTPHTSLESEKGRPKYGSEELGRTLMAQYPAIFHAATNVPAFIRALACMVNLEHISISCPDQEAVERYRRSSVDYALISLRIAIERAELPNLTKLSLACHPAALLYLHPTPNFGASPSALRRWRQIKNLKLSIDSWPFDNAPTDHLKLLANYLRVFAGSVEKLTFHWYGQRGPCPLTMPMATSCPSSPMSSRHSSPTSLNVTSQKLFAEVTSPMSPLPLTPPADALHFEKLRRVQARNTYVTADQVCSFIMRHAASIKGMDFDNVVLTSGNWDDALAPLGRLSSKEAIWEARHSGSFTGTDLDLLSCSSKLSTTIDEVDNPYSWQPREVVEDERRPLRESYVKSHMAATPSHINIAKKHKRRRRRRTVSPPPPPPSLRHQASHLLDKLKKEASQSSFFSMFRHHDSGCSVSSNASSHSFHSIPKVVDEQVFLATPRHNRAMPSVPANQSDYFDLGEDDFSQPAYEPELVTLLKPTTYQQGPPLTPPRTPTKQQQKYSGTPRSQVWEFDRPRSLASISEAPLLAPTTYSPFSVTEQSRHPLDRRPTVEDAPLTPPESPVMLLGPAVYTPPSMKKTCSPVKTASPCEQIAERKYKQQQHERVRGQAIPQPPSRPPMVSMPALTPMLESVKTPCTPWPCLMTRSLTPMPLKIDTSVAPHRQLAPQQVQQGYKMDSRVQGNQRDVARENRYVELANNAEKRDEVLRTARERVMGRLGRKYCDKTPSSIAVNAAPALAPLKLASLASQGAVMGRAKEVFVGRGYGERKGNGGMGEGAVREETQDKRVRGGQVQDAVRREMWTGCGDEFMDEVRVSTVDGRGQGRNRSVLVPFMILR